jgi:Zn finger protein HypA/HybF involved in hydrogenase expression
MKLFVKFLLIASQILGVITFIEMIAFRTFFSPMIGATFLIILIVLDIKCQSCGTELGDPRIVGTVVPIKPSIIDRCPVCGNPMIES